MIRRWLMVWCVVWLAVVARAQDVTQDILGAVNAARATVGVPPLAYNAQLAATAQQHSDDMATGGFLSHTGSDGSQFWERMRQNGYQLVTGAENVLYRWDTDVQGAFQQWYDSEGHRVNMLNPDYNEIGVAYAVAADGRHYFTMVLGSRGGAAPQPTAIPAQPTITPQPPTPLPPPTAVPALTSTPLPTASLPQPVTVSPTAIPPTSFPPPTAVAQVPAEPASDLRLIWDDRSFALINVAGKALDVQGVQFESTVATLALTEWQTPELSAPLWGVPAGDCLQVWGLSQSALSDKPDACAYRHAWIAIADNRLFWRGVPQFTVTNRGRIVAVCDTPAGICEIDLESGVAGDGPPVAPTPIPAPADGKIRLQYDGQSLTILNVSGGGVNLTGLRLQSERGTLRVEAWQNGFLTADLAAFPVGDCLQAWTLEVVDPPIPADCSTRHAWIALADTRVVWVGVGQFTVYQNDNQLGVCAVGTGRCEIQLP